MAGWRNEQTGGSGRTDDHRGPRNGPAWQASAPGDHHWSGRTTTPDGSRQGVDVRMNRRARVTAS
jgi:hypothetical protein